MFKWSEAAANLKALREEMEAEAYEEQDSMEESEIPELSQVELLALSEMIGCDYEELMEADTDVLAEMMGYMMDRIHMAAQAYGRPGLSGKKPWEKNEAPVSKMTSVQTPKPEAKLGGGKAVVPSLRTSPAIGGK